MTLGQQIAPYLSLSITLSVIGGMFWKRGAEANKIKSNIRSCNVDTKNKNDMQQKDIDTLMASNKDIRIKINGHGERIADYAVMFAKLDSKMEIMTDLMERIEKKLK